MSLALKEEDAVYSNFINSLRSARTKDVYDNALRQFMKFHNIESYSSLLVTPDIEEKIAADELWQKQIRKPETVFDVKYLGGHMAFPTKKPRDAKIGVFIDRIEIQTDKFKAKIPYEQIVSTENMDEKKISALRVVGLGLVFLPFAILGAMWKKKKLYTVIEYKEEGLGQTLVFDFGKHIENKQYLIYQKIISARERKKLADST